MHTRSILPRLALSLFALSAPLFAATSMFDTDYEGGLYNWGPLKTYTLGGNQQTDGFRDLTWFTHGDPLNYNATWNAPSFTSAGEVTLAGHTGTSIGSYIKWGIMGTGTMPAPALLGPIQSGTVTPELLAANPITPKAIDASRAFSVSTFAPVAGLSSVVLQLRTGTIFPAGMSYTPFELAQMAAPVVLSLNGGTIWKEWDFRELTHVGSDMFSAQYTQEVWSFQWDLSDVGVPITDFAIHWDSHPFGNLFGAQVDQSNVFTQVVAVPEASSIILAFSGAALCLVRRRAKAGHA